MYHLQIEVVADTEQSNPWLEKDGLKDSTRGTNHGSSRTDPAQEQKRLVSTTPDKTPGVECAERPLRQSSTV